MAGVGTFLMVTAKSPLLVTPPKEWLAETVIDVSPLTEAALSRPEPEIDAEVAGCAHEGAIFDVEPSLMIA